MTPEKPLFIPLKRKFFEAFKRREKDTEYRMHGPRWNLVTCRIGRAVILSLGYSGERIRGQIVDCTITRDPVSLPGWVECYGYAPALAVVIKIKVD